jgi:hypothetical protein
MLARTISTTWFDGVKNSLFALAFILVVSGCKSHQPIPSKRFDSIAIEGTPKFDEQVEKALTLLKARSHDGYATVTNYIGIIQEYEHSGMQVHHAPPVFQLNTNSAFYSVTWCAGVIAHDSIHSKLYFDYKQRHPWSLWVPAKVHGGDDAEHVVCMEHQLSVLKQIGAPTNEIAWCLQCETDTNRYWKVKYRDRDW